MGEGRRRVGGVDRWVVMVVDKFTITMSIDLNF